MKLDNGLFRFCRKLTRIILLILSCFSFKFNFSFFNFINISFIPIRLWTVVCPAVWLVGKPLSRPVYWIDRRSDPHTQRVGERNASLGQEGTLYPTLWERASSVSTVFSRDNAEWDELTCFIDAVWSKKLIWTILKTNWQ